MRTGEGGSFLVISFFFLVGYIFLVPFETEKAVVPHEKVKKVSNEHMGVILYNSNYELVFNYYFLHNLDDTKKFDVVIKENHYFYNTFSGKELILEKK